MATKRVGTGGLAGGDRTTPLQNTCILAWRCVVCSEDVGLPGDGGSMQEGNDTAGRKVGTVHRPPHQEMHTLTHTG